MYEKQLKSPSPAFEELKHPKPKIFLLFSHHDPLNLEEFIEKNVKSIRNLIRNRSAFRSYFNVLS